MKQYCKRYDHLRTLLLEGERLTYDRAKEKLQCSKRTVERILHELIADGLLVQKDEKGKHGQRVFFIEAKDRKASTPLPQKDIGISISEEQLFALLVATEAVRATFAPTPLGTDVASAFAVLRRHLPTEVLTFEPEEVTAQWNFSSGTSVQLDATMFWNIVDAIRDRERLIIDYYTASKGGTWTTDRSIEPHGIIIRNGSWILIAYCLKKQGWREFALAGIQKLRCTGETIKTEKPNLQEYLGNRFSAVGGDKTYNIVLEVEKDRVPYFERKVYHPSQRVEHREDGRARVHYTVDGLEEMRSFVQGWGTGVTVKKPTELVEMIRKEAEELARRYNTEQSTELEQ